MLRINIVGTYSHGNSSYKTIGALPVAGKEPQTDAPPVPFSKHQSPFDGHAEGGLNNLIGGGRSIQREAEL